MSPKQPNILFVCLGNICRSPMAHGVMEYYLKKDQSIKNLFGKIDSCGLGGQSKGEPTHQGTIDIIKQRLNYDFSKGVRLFCESDYQNFDLILTMDESNTAEVMSRLRGKDPEKKIMLFRTFDKNGNGAVPDPYYTDRFDQVFDIVDRTIMNMIELQKQGKLIQ